MKIRELRGLSDAEMRAKAAELRKELMKENAQIAIGTIPKSPGKIRLIKKNIARIATILAEKEGKQKA